MVGRLANILLATGAALASVAAAAPDEKAALEKFGRWARPPA